MAATALRAFAQWMRGFLDVARSVPLVDPPPIVRQRLHASFERWRDTQSAMRDEIARFDASIVFDSRTDLVAGGVRAGLRTEPDGVVHLAYTTDAADLVLDVRPPAVGRVRIDGQVLLARPTASPIFEATASGSGFTTRTLDGDDLGRFCLESVPDTALQVSATNGEIHILAQVDLRAATE